MSATKTYFQIFISIHHLFSTNNLLKFSTEYYGFVFGFCSVRESNTYFSYTFSSNFLTFNGANNFIYAKYGNTLFPYTLN